MYYYIIDNRIIGFMNKLDEELYSYPQLTVEQSQFYETYNCTLNEVLNLKLNDKVQPSLDDVKQSKIQYFSSISFEYREQVLPEYKMVNAGLGIYNAEEVARIVDIVKKYREEYYRCKTAVEQATTIEQIEAIEYNVQ